MADSDTPSPLAAGQIEIWKKIVDVQQHFNDLELRIRNFALIITGAFLGMGDMRLQMAASSRSSGSEYLLPDLLSFLPSSRYSHSISWTDYGTIAYCKARFRPALTQKLLLKTLAIKWISGQKSRPRVHSSYGCSRPKSVLDARWTFSTAH
ncbi:hypothetical protein GT370_12285 [Acidocella sp. MX-AZ03]|uniref:hypothetical protein n=1 Tax=Acidocella sp. MX-AZ03 TaxID=2697363 RepID=UPI0022DCF222|nr:hypothetical protein [Acidocella sp. MX-AZ03]WBO58039.1 hypothetical protein GT370_12285 [Acidocella sp. MX-AZ03]